MAFKHLDLSVFDDSTGFKLLKYLTKDNERRDVQRPKLFQDILADESDNGYSVRVCRDQTDKNADQNCNNKPRRSINLPANSTENRSSVFKPIFASTPVVNGNGPNRQTINAKKMATISPRRSTKERPQMPGPETPPVQPPVQMQEQEKLYPDLNEVRKSTVKVVPIHQLMHPTPQQQPAAPVEATPVLAVVPEPAMSTPLTSHVPEVRSPRVPLASVQSPRRNVPLHDDIDDNSFFARRIPISHAKVVLTDCRRTRSIAERLSAKKQAAPEAASSTLSSFRVPRSSRSTINKKNHELRQSSVRFSRAPASPKAPSFRMPKAPNATKKDAAIDLSNAARVSVHMTPNQSKRRLYSMAHDLETVTTPNSINNSSILVVPELEQQKVETPVKTRKTRDRQTESDESSDSDKETRRRRGGNRREIPQPSEPVEEEASVVQRNRSKRDRRTEKFEPVREIAPPKASAKKATTKPTANENVVFKVPAVPKPRKERQRDLSVDSTGDVRRSSRESKPRRNYVLPFYVLNDSHLMRKAETMISNKQKESTAKKKPAPKRKEKQAKRKIEAQPEVVNQPEDAIFKEPDSEPVKKVPSRRPEKSKSTKAPKRAKSALKQPPIQPPETNRSFEAEKHDNQPEIMQKDQSIPESEIELPLTPVVFAKKPREKRKTAKTNSTAFQPPSPTKSASSTRSTASRVSQMIDITDRNAISPFFLQNKDKVLYQKITGGHVYTYGDFETGNMVLETVKPPAKVKKNNLTLSIINGSVLVNLQGENSLVKLSKHQSITIPVGEIYTMENMEENPSTLMFSWKAGGY